MRNLIGRTAILLLVAALAATALGCSGLLGTPIEIGSFSVKEAPSYEIQPSKNSPGMMTTVNGVEIHREEAMAMARESEYGIALACYEDVSLDDARAYFESWSPGDAIEQSSFPLPYSADDLSVQLEDFQLPNGTQGVLWTVASSEGSERFTAWRVLVFPASEDSLGVVSLCAFNTEMFEAEQRIFDEVLENIVIP